MAKPVPTRTIGPLHFEDLEPHRFEDLIRQLVYDFRPWKQLEATGRSGSDDGFDVRGFEAGPNVEDAGEESEDDSDDGSSGLEDRLWLIQCKREHSIGPKKLGSYLDEMPASESSQLYGIIFAAACDFSKLARDLFREKTRAMGVGEAYLWGKAEIEDMLFQPKNDHLLFSYFGISLQVRRRSLRTDLRARLTTKRKAIKVLQNWGAEALIRDASDERYPYLDDDEKLDRFERGRWYIYSFYRCRHDGIHFQYRRYLAFLDDDGVAWDYAERMNDAVPNQNPWLTEDEEKTIEMRRAAREEAFPIWQDLPEKNRAWFEKFLILPYENILAIDETGDEIFKGPHIYTAPFTVSNGPFRSQIRVKLKTIGQWDARRGNPDKSARTKKFPREDNQQP